MKKMKLNLQYFGEGGGDGTGTASFAGTDGVSSEGAGMEVSTPERKGRNKNPLANVVYGKQSQAADANTGRTPDTFVDTKQTADKATEFENLIRGEYKDLFDSRVQGIIDKRFAKAKETEGQMKALQPMLDMLSQKYGTDASDYEALSKAIQDDDSYYEDEAIEKGLTVKQLKEQKRLERENENLRRAQKEAQDRYQSDQIYSGWLKEVEEFNGKYGMQMDFASELQSKDFCAILKNGGSVESAYMAIHFNEMLGGAMQFTANQVRQKMANNLQSRAQRPSENGISSRASSVTKTNVKDFTKADRKEIMRRVARGDIISL